ncbi:PorP/SprF family type IX secretion system membrane protein [Pedobacter glucosidilyticus]|uniref:PorP/SprF family type IX secretion system membrane protein n=1 Tax=Pedobacter glucosidilyticus TaxID=1122941 RepID=UPI00047DF667|nr:type IX secretion system membrane protein PorP/SprF [Pedobacter glucosidilyticus]
MRVLLLIVFFILLIMGVQAQQQAMYTQYMFNTLAINPAYPTLDESLSVTALSRHQWVGFKGAPNTQTISIHSPIGTSETFIGGLLINDQIGEVIKETGGYITLAQRVQVGYESYLSVGVNGGLSSFRGNFSENYPFSPESFNDPVFQNVSNLRGNFGIGVMLFSSKYYVGLSSPHFYNRDLSDLGQPNIAGRYKPHYLLQAGYLINLNDILKLKPNILAKYVHGSPLQFDINANMLVSDRLWLGVSYRTLDSFDAMASFFVNPDFQVGYSYDFTNTALATVQKGSHEIMVKFRMPVFGRDHTACYF